MTFEKTFVPIEGRNMAYIDVGAGAPIVFLHGNPTSSYLWRNVLPPVIPHGRCIAPDLIGMGDSEKLIEPTATTYRFETHSRYLDGFMEALGCISDVILVLHDWGSALGFDWANRHPEAVRGIVYMEAIVQPFPTWDDFSKEAAPLFQALRSDAGEMLIFDKNVFIERILPGSVLGDLAEEDMRAYRKPFGDKSTRWPMLTWPREIPIAGAPADVTERVADYASWMATNTVPKLFIDADPGAILTGVQREFCMLWPEQTVVRVAGSHFIQEDSGTEIGARIAHWVSRLPALA